MFLISAVSLLLLGIVAVPATDAAMMPHFGLSVGANFQSVEDFEDAGDAFSSQTGYNAGVFAELGFGSWAIRPGVEYLNAGPLFDGGFDSSNFDLSYVMVPVDLKMSIPTPAFSPYFFTGPEFRVLASSGDAPSDVDEGLRDFGINWSLGLGMQLGAPGPGMKVSPEVRYSRDLSGVLKDEFEVEGVTVTTDGGQKSHSFRAALKLTF
jgi:hypothetical protein